MGLGVLPPTPNPQSPIPNPQSPIPNLKVILLYNMIFILQKKFNKKNNIKEF
jgi:hypothetical protein